MITEIAELIQTVKRKLPEYLIEHGSVTDPFKKFSCLFPEHDDSSASMNVHKDGTFAYCFGCQKGIDIFTAANIFESKPLDGADFIEKNVYYLADKYNIKYKIIGNNVERAALKYAYLRAYKLTSEFLTNTALKSPTEYYTKELSKRKWGKKESADLGLGCCHKFKDVYDMLIANDFTKEFLELCGLLRSDMFNGDSVIFTIYDTYGRPIAFYSRDTQFEVKKLAYDNRDKMDVSGTKQPMKYNSTANFNGVYEKVLYPYGIHDAKDFHKVIVVEGHSCKMTLRQNGIDNVIALGGLSLGEQTINKLIGLGVTSLVFCLDNDTRGKERLKNLIRQYYGKLSLDLYVLDIGEGQKDQVKDPDEFIRKFSAIAFKEIIEQNALSWLATTELFEKGDIYAVLEEIVPLIANERDPLKRHRIINTISDMSGIDKGILAESVDQKISTSKDRKGEYALKILDEARELVAMNPNALEAAVNMISSKLDTLNKGNSNEELYSSNESLKALVKLEEGQDSGETIPIIKTGYPEFDELIPLPTNEAFILLPAAPNCGKTTFFVSCGNNILDSNDDVMVIHHTIDDSRDIIYNRFVANRAQIHMNWIKNPKFYLNEELARKRKAAYRHVSDWVRDERLIVKDAINGTSVEYLGNLIRYYRDKYPNRKIVVFCDNFHKLSTESGIEDKRLRTEYISQLVKGYTNKYDCIVFATVELGKMGMHEKPTNASAIKETGALEYDANLILFLWNSLNSERNKEVATFDSTVMTYNKEINSYIHKPVKKPIIEMLVLKNKLSEYKGEFFFKLHPELAFVDFMTHQEFDELKKPVEE